MSKPLQLDAPSLGATEKEYLSRAIDTGFVSTAGPFVPEFETKFAGFLKAGWAVAVQSGTAALHIALVELGVGPGDEVIVPALTFVASVNPVVYQGATPVFVDVEPTSWTMDAAAVAKAITSKTKAIIPVHLYGFPCQMEPIMQLAGEYGLAVIEDATESLGAAYQGQMTGTIGDIGCFSFNGNKLMTTGGGGMVVTRDPQRASHLKFLVNQARDPGRSYYFHPEIGYNYRMTNLEAALGLAQMERLEEFLALKKSFYRIYDDVFQNANGITLQRSNEFSNAAAWLTSLQIDPDRFGIAIPELQTRLTAQGIPTRRIFQPIVASPPYQRYQTGTYPNSYRLFENGLNLPSSTLNTPEAIQQAAEMILKVLGT